MAAVRCRLHSGNLFASSTARPGARLPASLPPSLGTAEEQRSGPARHPRPRHCGRKYIDTAVQGRNARYRYYTCFSHNRYGAAGCNGVRLAADATDTAVLQALHDFYTNAHTILDKVITEALAQFHDTHADRHAELDADNAQITNTQAATERYHHAFENGTMDDATAGPRITELRHKITQLQAHRDDLAASLDNEPTPPPTGTIERLRAYLTQS
ncbi:zinc ribbon domain-containing protein [Salinispora arenicola]|uniref:zinc ribbon domain-containing protein n=1 Tax=Salinispora arenicola TaxID=168697 RepID=UPI0002E8D4A0|nr:zinc ribbon domain-containing protein [Salinispora arenicola]